MKPDSEADKSKWGWALQTAFAFIVGNTGHAFLLSPGLIVFAATDHANLGFDGGCCLGTERHTIFVIFSMLNAVVVF